MDVATQHHRVLAIEVADEQVALVRIALPLVGVRAGAGLVDQLEVSQALAQLRGQVGRPGTAQD